MLMNDSLPVALKLRQFMRSVLCVVPCYHSCLPSWVARVQALLGWTYCGQAKIEARSQALVVPTELTRSMIICVFCIAESDKVVNKSSFMQLKSI